MKNSLYFAKKGIKLIFILVLCASAITVGGICYASQTFGNIKENIVRLHVIANSDSEDDQALKLLVRDKVLDCTKNLNVTCNSAQEYTALIENEIPVIKETVDNYLKELGSDYSVSISVGESVFPAKSYGDIVLPSGNYNAIKVNIGSGEGKNWWCVMFPPLCCTNSGTFSISDESKAVLKENLSSEAYKTISGEADEKVILTADDGLVSENVKVNVRFKLVEVFKSLFGI